MKFDFAFRDLVALMLIGLFGAMLAVNPHDQTVIGALLTAFAGAWGFYLGGSKVGADTATKNADTLSNQATANSATPEPQPVTVVNEADQPVPVETAK